MYVYNLIEVDDVYMNLLFTRYDTVTALPQQKKSRSAVIKAAKLY